MKVLCLILIFLTNNAVGIIYLNGIWNVKNSSMESGIPAKVPGGVHLALMDSGIIGDPFYRMNDKNYRWVGRTDWSFYLPFNETFLQKDVVLLVCDGLDTVSVVYINDKEVGRSVNMFVRYIYDVKQALQVDENTIRVDFTSAVTYGKQQQDKLFYSIPPNCPPAVFQGECYGNKVRKMQCAFSWDWGPAFVTQGIWKDIYLQSFDSAVIRDVTTETTKDASDLWVLKIEIFFDVNTKTTVSGVVTYTLADTGITGSKDVQLSGDNREVSYSISITIPQDSAIEAWWPNGYGRQTLYAMNVTFQNLATSEKSSKVIKIGFRTVELVQELVSKKESDGRTFYFRINGQPIFLKGSNWIPADSFLERVTKDRMYNYLTSAADAHMNVLRVWGGGIYEFDEFYEIADELGMLIWQDFMFACALYPADDAFLQTVTDEITHQIRRLKHHPSLLAYSGNNENEVGLNGWWPVEKKHRADYLKLYIDVIYRLVQKEDPNTPFMSSSPSNGIKTEKDGWLSKLNPSSSQYGDIHDYNYFRPFYKDERYRTPRMSSEYGLQSYPSLETLAPVYDQEDMFYKSDLNGIRQHHLNGNRELMSQIKMYLNPPNASDPLQLFKDFIYCTQIDQAIGMRTETEHYRRWQSEITNKGEGNTMGALYWMLNDIWQAPTWSSLEYGGKWKVLHYYARHFFAPVLISTYKREDTLYVYIVLDEIPTYEERNNETHHLTFRPYKIVRSSNIPETPKSDGYNADKCLVGTKCLTNDVWKVLTVCFLFLLLNQMYHICWRGRYLKQRWRCTFCCLLIMLMVVTIHMVSFQEHPVSRTIPKLKTRTENGTKLTNLAGYLTIQLYSWDSLQVKYTKKIPFEIVVTSQLIYQVNISSLLEDGGCPGPDHCFLVSRLDGPKDSPVSWYPLSTFKEARGLAVPNLKIADVSESDIAGEFSISLTTDFPAPFVWLEAYGIKGRFCDNGFLMFERTKTIKFYSWEETNIESFKNSLSIKSLMDIYH